MVKTYCGHGIGELFHTLPNVPHYPKNKAKGVMKPGHIFTIEPMINLGTWQARCIWLGHGLPRTKFGGGGYWVTVLVCFLSLEPPSKPLTRSSSNGPMCRKGRWSMVKWLLL